MNATIRCFASKHIISLYQKEANKLQKMDFSVSAAVLQDLQCSNGFHLVKMSRKLWFTVHWSQFWWSNDVPKYWLYSAIMSYHICKHANRNGWVFSKNKALTVCYSRTDVMYIWTFHVQPACLGGRFWLPSMRSKSTHLIHCLGWLTNRSTGESQTKYHWFFYCRIRNKWH